MHFLNVYQTLQLKDYNFTRLQSLKDSGSKWSFRKSSLNAKNKKYWKSVRLQISLSHSPVGICCFSSFRSWISSRLQPSHFCLESHWVSFTHFEGVGLADFLNGWKDQENWDCSMEGFLWYFAIHFHDWAVKLPLVHSFQ